MQWFSAMIPAYPEIQKKAQDELDRVVGRDRLPTVEDEKNLPYCHAIIKEVRLTFRSSNYPKLFGTSPWKKIRHLEAETRGQKGIWNAIHSDEH